MMYLKILTLAGCAKASDTFAISRISSSSISSDSFLSLINIIPSKKLPNHYDRKQGDFQEIKDAKIFALKDVVW